MSTVYWTLGLWDVHKPFPCFDSWISTQQDGTAMVKFHCLSFVSPIQEGESYSGLDDHSSNTMYNWIIVHMIFLSSTQGFWPQCKSLDLSMCLLDLTWFNMVWPLVSLVETTLLLLDKHLTNPGQEYCFSLGCSCQIDGDSIGFDPFSRWLW